MQIRKSLAVFLLAILTCCAYGAEPRLNVEVTTLAQGDSEWDWTQARTAIVPGEQSLALTTMSRTATKGAHGYHDVFLAKSIDNGQTWSAPVVIPALKRFTQDDGYEVAAGDLWPMWHAASKTVLITGKTFNFAGGSKENILREKVAYAVLDPRTQACGPLQTLRLPARDHNDNEIIAPNAGCHQRVHLSNGDLLFPVRYQKSRKKRNYTSIVARCRFDGSNLTYVEHGSEHSIPTRRGLYEPSVTQFRDSFFLTMRADDGAWVAKSSDGIHYSDHIAWTFDDGQLLGSYNTQQHWLPIGDRLFLVYTRRGVNNDHIMRHRAPLFVAEVDVDKLHVIRSTEQIIVPENQATLGNSGVCTVSETEFWVTVAEGRVSHGRRADQNNKVLLVKISSR